MSDNFKTLNEYNQNEIIVDDLFKYVKIDEKQWACHHKDSEGNWNDKPVVATFQKLRVPTKANLENMTKSEVVKTQSKSYEIYHVLTKTKDDKEIYYLMFASMIGNGSRILRFYKDGNDYILDRGYKSIHDLKSYYDETDRLRSMMPIKNKDTISQLMQKVMEGEVKISVAYRKIVTQFKDEIMKPQTETKSSEEKIVKPRIAKPEQPLKSETSVQTEENPPLEVKTEFKPNAEIKQEEKEKEADAAFTVDELFS